MVGKRQGEAQRATCMLYVVCYVMMQLKFICPVRSCDAVLDGRPRPDLPCCVVAKALFDASPRMAVQRTLRDHLKLFSRYHACWAPPRHTLQRPSDCATGRRGSSDHSGERTHANPIKSGTGGQVPFSAERDKAAHLHRLPQLFLPSNSIAAWTRQAFVLIRHKGSCHNPRACSWSRFPSVRKLYLQHQPQTI